ncbi:hypothetical protein OUZ56_033157 [Daphnia magna]|uniref:Uncharacterized protein n=1 Tax=Daphnia magna TaxID=35525 RepID=A0ABR0BAD1_9CRUS|nr:hypothetical protein OUZ56_033157 [Daphnia magna]
MGTHRPRRARDRPRTRLDTEARVPLFFAMSSSRPERASQANFRVGGHRAAGPFRPEADAEGTKKVSGRERMSPAVDSRGADPEFPEAMIARLVATRTGGGGKRGGGMLVGGPLETGFAPFATEKSWQSNKQGWLHAPRHVRRRPRGGAGRRGSQGTRCLQTRPTGAPRGSQGRGNRGRTGVARRRRLAENRRWKTMHDA